MATKFVVAPRRVILGKEKSVFKEGDVVTADALGIDSKAFDTLVKDKSVVDVKEPVKAEIPEPATPANKGSK